MDYSIFHRQLCKAYKQAYTSFTFEECEHIFLCYFSKYRAYMGRDHPYLKTSKLTELIGDLAIQEKYNWDYSPSDYPIMIDSYFETEFSNSDRNICHFFSGEIRVLRYYEKLY